MPVFRVNLIRTVTDVLGCTVDVEASSQEAAAEYALAKADTLSFEYERELDHSSNEVDAVEPAPAGTLAHLTAPAPGAATTRYRLHIERWRHPRTSLAGQVVDITLFDHLTDELLASYENDDQRRLDNLLLDACALAECPVLDNDPPILPTHIVAVILSEQGIGPCDPDTLDVTCNED